VNIDFDRSLLGVPFPSGSQEVTRDLILGFCRTTGETDPLFTDVDAARRAGYPDLLAPPTLCMLLFRGAGRPNIQLRFGKSRLQAGQAVEALAPVVAGDVLTGTTMLKDVYAKTGRSGTMVFVVWEVTATNQRGERVALFRESYAARE
jgi:acyl dehydratase